MKNNANIIRLLAAILVLWGHGYALNGESDPLSSFVKQIISLPYNKNLPGVGVMVFFVLSGFLITGSFIRTKSVNDFIKKRCFRIYPALWGNLIFIFIFSAFITELSFQKFLSSSTMHTYFMTNILLVKGTAFVVPQVFSDNLFKGVNGSLWTLAHEIYCYLFVLVIGVCGLLSKHKQKLAIFLLFLIVLMGGVNSKLAYIYTSFILGMLFYLYRDIFSNYPKLMIILSVFMFFVDVDALKLVGLSIITIYISFYSIIKLPNIDKIGDLSYGTYLYAFPIQQIIVKYYSDELTVLIQNLFSLIITLFFAFISYRFIEVKTMYRKNKATLQGD